MKKFENFFMASGELRDFNLPQLTYGLNSKYLNFHKDNFTFRLSSWDQTMW